jgi:hypothetical protein
MPTRQLLYVEFREGCARRPNGLAAVLRGFSRKGAMTLSFDLMVTNPAAEAGAMASEILARFQQLDTAALAK